MRIFMYYKGLMVRFRSSDSTFICIFVLWGSYLCISKHKKTHNMVFYVLQGTNGAFSVIQQHFYLHFCGSTQLLVNKHKATHNMVFLCYKGLMGRFRASDSTFICIFVVRGSYLWTNTKHHTIQFCFMCDKGLMVRYGFFNCDKGIMLCFWSFHSIFICIFS
jgi:hypothetical protein